MHIYTARCTDKSKYIRNWQKHLQNEKIKKKTSICIICRKSNKKNRHETKTNILSNITTYKIKWKPIRTIVQLKKPIRKVGQNWSVDKLRLKLVLKRVLNLENNLRNSGSNKKNSYTIPFRILSRVFPSLFNPNAPKKKVEKVFHCASATPYLL